MQHLKEAAFALALCSEGGQPVALIKQLHSLEKKD
jgi:hypothetical protein